MKSDSSEKNLKLNNDVPIEKQTSNLFPSFDHRQINKLNQSFYSNQKRYNPREKPQNHVLMRQTDW